MKQNIKLKFKQTYTSLIQYYRAKFKLRVLIILGLTVFIKGCFRTFFNPTFFVELIFFVFLGFIVTVIYDKLYKKLKRSKTAKSF